MSPDIYCANCDNYQYPHNIYSEDDENAVMETSCNNCGEVIKFRVCMIPEYETLTDE